jgi:phosphoserine phosphatase RsbU/P
MTDFLEIKQKMSKLEQLERELHLKQLQINSLLNITQAINDNLSASDLFDMYRRFLDWEIGVRKMALFILKNGVWKCMTHINVPKELLDIDITPILKKHTRPNQITEDENPLAKLFDIIIPVSHKDVPIAYAFIGGFTKGEDMYNKLQFITTITNIVAVAIENKRLFKKQIEQEGIRREMEWAGEMQRLLIPSKFPKSATFELSGVYMPHFTVGGDYFDFIEFDEHKMMFCIADISGKGISAAIMMANFQANLRSLVRRRDTPQAFLEALNRSIYRITQGDRYLTFFIAEYDQKNRRLRYANAGHVPPMLLMDNKIHHLKEGCTILGAFPKLPKIRIGTIDLPSEATLLAFTDGLTDIRNENQDEFEVPMIETFLQNNHHLTAEKFNQALVTHTKAFKGVMDYPDDFTLMTCKFL